jgi:hypothetical protein
MGQDLLCKPLIEECGHCPKILGAPIEIYSTTKKFR